MLWRQEHHTSPSSVGEDVNDHLHLTTMKRDDFRNRPRRDFTIIRNAALRDPNLSLKAKGALALMLSFPDDSTYHLQHLQTMSSDGRDATRGAIAELEAAGYLTRRQTRDENGKLGPAVFEFFDKETG